MVIRRGFAILWAMQILRDKKQGFEEIESMKNILFSLLITYQH